MQGNGQGTTKFPSTRALQLAIFVGRRKRTMMNIPWKYNENDLWTGISKFGFQEFPTSYKANAITNTKFIPLNIERIKKIQNYTISL